VVALQKFPVERKREEKKRKSESPKQWNLPEYNVSMETENFRVIRLTSPWTTCQLWRWAK